MKLIIFILQLLFLGQAFAQTINFQYSAVKVSLRKDPQPLTSESYVYTPNVTSLTGFTGTKTYEWRLDKTSGAEFLPVADAAAPYNKVESPIIKFTETGTYKLTIKVFYTASGKSAYKEKTQTITVQTRPYIMLDKYSATSYKDIISAVGTGFGVNTKTFKWTVVEGNSDYLSYYKTIKDTVSSDSNKNTNKLFIKSSYPGNYKLKLTAFSNETTPIEIESDPISINWYSPARVYSLQFTTDNNKYYLKSGDYIYLNLYMSNQIDLSSVDYSKTKLSILYNGKSRDFAYDNAKSSSYTLVFKSLITSSDNGQTFSYKKSTLIGEGGKIKDQNGLYIDNSLPGTEELNIISPYLIIDNKVDVVKPVKLPAISSTNYVNLSGSCEPNAAIEVKHFVTLDQSSKLQIICDYYGNFAYNVYIGSYNDGQSISFVLTQTDPAGNISKEAKLSTKKDLAPITPYSVGMNSSTTNERLITIGYSPSIDAYNFSNHEAKLCSVNDCSSTQCTASVTSKTSSANVTLTADGIYWACVRGVDKSKNYSSWASSYNSIAVGANFKTPKVLYTTSTKPNGTYLPGDLIDISIKFDKSVYLYNTSSSYLPSITTNSSGVALYKSGNGTDTWSFTYKIIPGQNTTYGSKLDLSYVNNNNFKDVYENTFTIELPTTWDSSTDNALSERKSIFVSTPQDYVTISPDYSYYGCSSIENCINLLNINQLIATNYKVSGYCSNIGKDILLSVVHQNLTENSTVSCQSTNTYEAVLNLNNFKNKKPNFIVKASFVKDGDSSNLVISNELLLSINYDCKLFKDTKNETCSESAGGDQTGANISSHYVGKTFTNRTNFYDTNNKMTSFSVSQFRLKNDGKFDLILDRTLIDGDEYNTFEKFYGGDYAINSNGSISFTYKKPNSLCNDDLSEETFDVFNMESATGSDRKFFLKKNHNSDFFAFKDVEDNSLNLAVDLEVAGKGRLRRLSFDGKTETVMYECGGIEISNSPKITDKSKVRVDFGGDKKISTNLNSVTIPIVYNDLAVKFKWGFSSQKGSCVVDSFNEVNTKQATLEVNFDVNVEKVYYLCILGVDKFGNTQPDYENPSLLSVIYSKKPIATISSNLNLENVDINLNPSLSFILGIKYPYVGFDFNYALEENGTNLDCKDLLYRNTGSTLSIAASDLKYNTTYKLCVYPLSVQKPDSGDSTPENIDGDAFAADYVTFKTIDYPDVRLSYTESNIIEITLKDQIVNIISGSKILNFDTPNSPSLGFYYYLSTSNVNYTDCQSVDYTEMSYSSISLNIEENTSYKLCVLTKLPPGQEQPKYEAKSIIIKGISPAVNQ